MEMDVLYLTNFPPLTLVLSFPHFCGEPDGSLAFPGELIPFALVEVGVYDSQLKTNARTEHWLRRGAGKVFDIFQTL